MSADRILSSSLGSLLTGENLDYLEQLSARFKRDPSTVDPVWHLALSLLDEQPLLPSARAEIRQRLRQRGHFAALLDPIAGRASATTPSQRAASIAPGAEASEYAALADLYCGSLGIETEHIDDEALRNWAYLAVETYEAQWVDPVAIGRTIIEASEFERLMQTKFTAKKRFGAEGAEAVVVLLKRILWRLAAQGIDKVVIGTMHRGRLNLLSNALGRPLSLTLAEFSGKHPFGNQTAADVPYHLGWQGAVAVGDGRQIAIDLLPNPSHLEAVNPVVLGKARGLQDISVEKIATIMLHTDAAVIGQGSIAELVQLTGLSGYSTGGTIHIVINNQIGFTTNPTEARTSKYCTGTFKATDSLILHANGDVLDAVTKAADIAADYRCLHRRDSVIDLVCYRRNGHNEIDEPRFTQPVLYHSIDGHPHLADICAKDLVDRGLTTADVIEGWKSAYADHFLSVFDTVKKDLGTPKAVPEPVIAVPAAPEDTGVDIADISNLLLTLSEPPANVPIDRRLERIVRGRADLMRTGINWPTAEALAFSTINAEGVPVRLTGQDVVRGAFSHRHFMLTDVDTGEQHLQIARVNANRPMFDVRNSPLSEYAILGFEYGYSLARPDCLVIWEAQFGDFANGAQIIIDQFVSSGREKWNIDSNLVLMLPHGLDGQGPEHSSARTERFLQLSQPFNLDVAMPSTPANYFHLLRAQAKRSEKRPLVIMNTKALLRHPAAVSPMEAFGAATTFLPVITSKPANNRSATLVIFCSGKIAYDLEARRDERNLHHVAVVRIEQLAPFPVAELVETLKNQTSAVPVFLQEEPENMGALDYVRPRLEAVLRDAGWDLPVLRVVARKASASPAGSFHGLHEQDQSTLVDTALRGGDAAVPLQPFEQTVHSQGRQ
ncbi:2-oxoglutarate dehydrogenase E1 component [Ensifer adhaerens]|uniref:2-oxoglutarate dehydrogenase E1 component n=1 Tax=Ensifer adhaerens TaxID=106592 RepID=UPI001CBD6D9D|nr:2-oxoglutarate dehydrogenase E1 component [Ensifer adhaerens]MBZ7924340.1 2-oxoglutarate dehydrogenase E1 component [Ensifer adhaerens]UAX96411.1 2-oxoglutarate dehydrogenase E1 component [Ensifer adhaerens]UAY04246.1 2-oxoglutarate dehydrogenase E1 component [Ensifer adhaerens]UAY12232.1 2-oxoglutarate dehydrogenase E1 component [Ensifer adhaerens]